ncbi:MAG: hypothetical protein ACI956_001308 [Nonlabens sp.]|jgi:hypothetical protein
MTKSFPLKVRFLILGLLLSSFAYANNGDPIVKLCSGKEMNWDEYLMFKRLNADEYDIELESFGSKDFIPYRQSFVNNTVGAWSSVIQMPLVAIAGANLPNGKLMTWSAKDKLSFGGNLGRTWTTIFDPSNNSSAEFLITNTQHDMFCPGVTTLPDGRVMATGGSSSDKSSIYDPYTGDWSTNDALNIPRGYQSQVTLASGATFTIGGSWSGGLGGKDAEIWSEKSGWFRTPGIPVTAITDGTNSNQPVQHDDYFPWLWVAPNGKLFHAGPSTTMHWIDTDGLGSYTSAGLRGDDDYSINGNTVMYDIGKILKLGGATTFEEQSAANNKTYVIDLNSNTPQVTPSGNLNYSRNCHNAVVLPSGEVVTFGGMPTSFLFSDANSRLIPELWNPNTQSWSQMAAMQTPRNYHSIALLLADGRVFVAGSGLCGSCSTNHPDAEIFSPPYLFNSNGTLATRPVINNAPTTANYNSNITVGMNSSVSSFSLVRNSAVTHSTNNDQRRIPVSATNLGGNQYQLNISNRNILPPGSYMLFAMNAAGTPSVSKIIQIGNDINNCTPLSNNVSGGTGLEATYFNSINLSGTVSTQVDPTIDFSWGTAGPTGLPVDNFSVRWEGEIEVPRSGTYTFYTNSDDGVRLWVNGVPMVDNWTNHTTEEDIAMIQLEANQHYTIRLEYYESSGDALIQLSWSGPGINKEIIPSNNLFPPSGNCTVGSNCNDGNACTVNDIYDSNCNCAGTEQDSDNDGVCDANDSCPNFNDSLIGTSCDDGNPNTTDDVYLANCSCAGTPGGGGTPDCNNIGVSTGAGVITVTGLDGAPISSVQVFNSNWTTVYSCFADCNLPTENISVPDGNYFVYVKYFNENYIQVCQVNDSYTVGGGGGCPDNDNDGICANVDCNDNDPNLPATVGSACNDNNANTNNDVIQSDGCTCEGTPSTGPNDCSFISITAGSGSISVSGLNSPITQVQIFDPSWTTILNCAGNCDAPTQTINNLANGTYFVKARLYTANWTVICDVEEFVTVGGGGVDCDNINFTYDGTNLTVTGLDSRPVSILQVFNSSWSEVFNCAGDCNGTEVLPLANDTYFVKAALYTSSWSPVCSKEAYVNSSTNLVAQQDSEDFLFSAVKDGRAARLYWVTNTEYKNEYFEVERSLNNIDFEVVDEKESDNNYWNAHFNYSGKDVAPQVGTNYYRIKKTHQDGTVAYSEVRTLTFDEMVNNFTVFPNPAKDEFFIQLSDFVGESGTISIYNAFGQLMTERSEDEISEGALRFSTSNFESGLYVVVVRMADRKVLSKKVMVARE